MLKTTRNIDQFFPHAPLAVLLLSLCATMPLRCAAQASALSARAQTATALSGNVVEASSKPVSGARVFAQPETTGTLLTVTTDASGTFVLKALAPGSYVIHAETATSHSKPLTIAVGKGSGQKIRIVLDLPGSAAVPAGLPSAGDAMDFVDKPTFTVAGVTDWTAVGGHGSDATLRTSEELNREALALKAQEPRQSAARSIGDKADDEYHLALALQRSGDFRAAQLHVQRALAQKDAGAYHRLAGELEEALGNPLAAVQQQQRATQLDPSEENYFAWGSELLLHRAIWQAAEVFANAAKAYPNSARVKTAWGATLFAGGLYDDAAQKICEASDLDPAAREPYLFAGKIALTSAPVTSCVPQKLQRFLALQPEDAQANYLYAMFLLKHGSTPEPERVQQLLLRAVTLDPKCSDAYLQLGILSSARKDYSTAIAYYIKALEANPHQGEAHYRLGVAYDRTGNPAKAATEYRLHDQIDAANAAVVEQQRREVKQFSIVTKAQPASPVP